MRIQVNARNRAHQFEAAQGARILYCGLAQGVGLPYECGSGTCGTCRARLVGGEIDDLWPEAAGRRYLKRPGEFLMCQCVAKNDCALEVSSFVHAVDPGTSLPAFGRGRLSNLQALAPDVIGFSLELDAPREFDAGQFLLLQPPGVPGYRGYSMVNHERGARRLDFVVRKKPGGAASAWLFRGDAGGKLVDWFGPLGSATFVPGTGKNLLCIAGGSGIAGMMAILSRASQERHFDQFSGDVFFGVRTYRDAFFLEPLAQFVRAAAGRLKVTVALSEEDVPADAQRTHPALDFARGLVHEVAAARMQGRYQNLRAYVAGPPPAVDGAIRMLLMQAKLTAAEIRYDKFS